MAEENFFQKISREMLAVRTASNVKKKTRESVEWFTNKIVKSDPKRINIGVVFKGRRNVQKFVPGQMYTYRYTSKLFDENKLAYYDRAPLIICLGEDRHGNLMGLNLHYLPPQVRARILSALMKNIKAKKLRHDTKMKISYADVKSISKFKPLKFALKTYIPDRIGSKMVRIQPEEWHHSIFLPYQNFVGSTERKIWKENPYL